LEEVITNRIEHFLKICPFFAAPFEEEEEGTGIVSDVVKLKGEDPATPGPLP